MDQNIVVNGSGSIIMAEGHAKRFWSLWKTVAVGVAGGLLALAIGLVWLLSRPLPIPEGTLFYAVATPSDAAQWPSEVRNAIPQDWKSYLDRDSRLPFVFGVYREGETLFSFVISPRWHAPKTEKIHQTTKGLTLFAADTDVKSVLGRSYWSFLVERWTTGAPVFGVRPYEALGFVNGQNQEWINLREDGNLVRSTIAAPSAPLESLSDADISLHISTEGAEYLKKHFDRLAYLPTPDRLSRLPALSRADFIFGEPGEPLLTRLEFGRALSEEEAGILLGAYGFTIRRPIVLPDGSVSFERTEPTPTPGTSLLGPRKDELGRLVTITGTTFELQHTSTTIVELKNASACSNAPAWARLSASTVSALAKRFGLKLNPDQVRPLQIVSENEKLAVCFE